jgi:Uma2 family endonuclease
VSISTPMSPLSAAPVQHALLEGVRFETYERLLEDLGDCPVRLTYDRGVLEIMSPSHRHERIKCLIAQLVWGICHELAIPFVSGGSTTWRRQDLEKGLEPDECFWIKNEARIRRRMDLDFRVDPPPDLAIEVDIHARSLERMVIYDALGVPEVWRYRDDRITVHLRQEDGGYRESENSACFPWLSMADLSIWLIRASSGEQDVISLMRAFREWVRSAYQSFL